MDSPVQIIFTCQTRDGNFTRHCGIRNLIIAGWTGRDKEAMEAHISELEALGVARPASRPIFYRIAAARLTTAGNIQVSGNRSSGEVEFVLVNIEGAFWIGVGSDHTDREVETYDITVSKQMCDKPIAGELWPVEEIEDHWDSLMVRSFVVNDDKRELYQEGSISAMLPAGELLKRYEENHGITFQPGDVMFCGTLAAIGEIRTAQRFEFELEDPVLNKKITHGYDTEELSISG